MAQPRMAKNSLNATSPLHGVPYSGQLEDARLGTSEPHQSTVAPLMPPREADDVSDVGHPRKIAQETVESESKTSVRDASIPSEIHVPLQRSVLCFRLGTRCALEAMVVHRSLKFGESMLTH